MYSALRTLAAIGSSHLLLSMGCSRSRHDSTKTTISLLPT